MLEKTIGGWMKLRVAVLGILTVLVTTSFSYGAGAAKLRLGYSAVTATMAPLWAAVITVSLPSTASMPS